MSWYPGRTVVTREAIERLASALPGHTVLDDVSIDLEIRTRAVLGLILLEKREEVPSIPPDPMMCPNCGIQTDSTRSPYCSESCREVSAFIRQFRSGIEGDLSSDFDRQAVMGQMLWYLLGGGLPRRVAMVPEKAIQKVLEREGARCQDCGGVAMTIDHSRTACNRPINLRAVCSECCRVRNYEDRTFRSSECFGESLAGFATRIQNPEAVRCCDDGETWNWRDYVNSRKKGKGL